MRKSWKRCLYHLYGPWCSPSQSHFSTTWITAPSIQAVSWRQDFGNTTSLHCATTTQIDTSQSQWGCLGNHEKILPLNSYLLSSYHHWPSNYSMGVIALCRWMPANRALVASIPYRLAGLRQAGGSNRKYQKYHGIYLGLKLLGSYISC